MSKNILKTKKVTITIEKELPDDEMFQLVVADVLIEHAADLKNEEAGL